MSMDFDARDNAARALALARAPVTAPFVGSAGTATPPDLGPGAQTDLGLRLAIRGANLREWVTADASATVITDNLQKVLDYLSDQALAMSSTAYDNLLMRQVVEFVLPRGKWLVEKQIVVPPYVDFVGQGSIVRAASGALAANVYLPTMVFSPRAHCQRLSLYTDATGDAPGNGVVFGKHWFATAVAVGAGGAGHAVNDVVTYVDNANRFKSPELPIKCQVTSVGANGTITGLTMTDGGQFFVRPAKMPVQLVQVYTKNVSTSQTSTGSTITPTWTPDFSGSSGSVYTYQAGANVPVGQTRIGDVIVNGVPESTSLTTGPMFGVLMNTKNAQWNRIEVIGGRIGVLNTGTDNNVNAINAVLCDYGLWLRGSALVCPNVVLDSCFRSYLYADAVKGNRLAGRAFWADGNDPLAAQLGYGPGSDGAAFQIGQGTTSYTVDCDFDFKTTNVGAVAAIPMAKIDYIHSSRIRINGSNFASGSSTTTQCTKKISAFANLGAHVASSVFFDGQVDGVSGPLLTGTQHSGGAQIWDSAANGMVGFGGTYDLRGSGAPTGATGQNKVPAGALYRDIATGIQYRNTGTVAAPSWATP
jgi:hypothetical protein